MARQRSRQEEDLLSAILKFSFPQSIRSLVYQTTPLWLDRSQFRLLTLHPSARGTPVSCSLVRVELHSAPAYEALSYTWGNTENPGVVVIDQHPIRITRNLYDALQDLRLRSRSTVLWIDASCINQDDLTERSEQVQQMTSIYYQASKVLVWLGSSICEDVRAAVHFFQQWPASKLFTKDHGKTIVNPRQVLEDSKVLYSSYMPSKQFRGVLQILQRPWFSRGWVVQEVTVAKEAIIGFGPLDCDAPNWFSWDTLCEMDHHLMQAMLSYHEGDVVVFGLATTQLGSMMQLRAAAPNRGALRLKFEDIVRQCQNFRTTDPRDKIFALLGLATNRADLGLKPDYTESPQDLYTKTMKAVCREARSLDLLTLEMDHKLPGLPSWVKDFSSSYEPHVSAGGVIATLTDLKYSASGDSAPLPKRSGTTKQHQMYTNGKCIGTVKHTLPIKLKLLSYGTTTNTGKEGPLESHMEYS